MEQSWSHAPHGPSVGNYAAVIVLDEIVCRRCTKPVEEINAARGFHDTLSYEEAAEKEIVCSRCNDRIKE